MKKSQPDGPYIILYIQGIDCCFSLGREGDKATKVTLVLALAGIGNNSLV